jgi:hypothetical protein
MNHSRIRAARAATRLSGTEGGGARIAVVASTCFLLGAAGSAYWFHGGTKSEAPVVTGAESLRQLSEVSRAVLRRIDTPIELRFYARLDPSSVPASERAFALRVESLLAAYLREGAGKVKVALHDSDKDFSADTAVADGIKPFNLDKGIACFLGLAVDRAGRRESLPQLSADWEPALEMDVTRAISRLLESKPQAPTAAAPVKSDPAILEEVQRAVPNLASIPLDEAIGTLRDVALKELKAAVAQGDIEAQKARAQFVEAQKAGSEAEMQAARQRLQQLQASQMETLRRISAKSQAQVDALRQLKNEASK